MSNIVILGATSAMAEATARLFAEQGDSLYLVARNEEKLKAVADDLSARGAKKVISFIADLADTKTHQEILKGVIDDLQVVDIILVAYGSLPDQPACEMSYESAEREIQLNFLSVVSLLTLFSIKMEEQASGTIAVISSVAGDRGRQSNYVYGAAKGGLTIFLAGLRNRLQSKGVNVLTIKPGFVDSPMTSHLDKGPLFVGPDVIAQGIVKAISKNRNVVYLPWFWQIIMFIIRLIPEPIFKRLKL